MTVRRSYQWKKQSSLGPRVLLYDLSSGTIKYITAVPLVVYKKEYIAKIGDIVEESNQDYILKPAYLRYLEEPNSATIMTSHEKYLLQTSKQYPTFFEFRQALFVNNRIIPTPLVRVITK